MNLEEIDEIEADEKSQEVDSGNEVMHVGKSDPYTRHSQKFVACEKCFTILILSILAYI